LKPLDLRISYTHILLSNPTLYSNLLIHPSGSPVSDSGKVPKTGLVKDEAASQVTSKMMKIPVFRVPSFDRLQAVPDGDEMGMVMVMGWMDGCK